MKVLIAIFFLLGVTFQAVAFNEFYQWQRQQQNRQMVEAQEKSVRLQECAIRNQNKQMRYNNCILRCKNRSFCSCVQPYIESCW